MKEKYIYIKIIYFKHNKNDIIIPANIEFEWPTPKNVLINILDFLKKKNYLGIWENIVKDLKEKENYIIISFLFLTL